jgi:hypothetical protein
MKNLWIILTLAMFGIISYEAGMSIGKPPSLLVYNGMDALKTMTVAISLFVLGYKMKENHGH